MISLCKWLLGMPVIWPVIPSSHLHGLITPDDVLIQFDLLMMRTMTFETCRQVKYNINTWKSASSWSLTRICNEMHGQQSKKKYYFTLICAYKQYLSWPVWPLAMLQPAKPQLSFVYERNILGLCHSVFILRNYGRSWQTDRQTFNNTFHSLHNIKPNKTQKPLNGEKWAVWNIYIDLTHTAAMMTKTMMMIKKSTPSITTKGVQYIYEGGKFNNGNYLFTSDIK